MDWGHYALDSEAWGVEICRNGDNVASAPGATPTFIIYDADGNQVATGTTTAFGSPAVTGAYRWAFSLTGPTFERKQTYVVFVSYTVDGDAHIGQHRFKCA